MKTTQHYTLYGEINKGDGVSMMHHILGHVEETSPEDYGVDKGPKHIVIHINSPGGDLTEAMAAINLMKSIKVPVTTVANVGVESAASMIFMAGDRRIVLPNSYAMTHSMSTEISGNIHELRASSKHMDMLEKDMIKFFLDHSLADMFWVSKVMLSSVDNYMNAEEMLRHGIADELVHPKDLNEVLENYEQIKKGKYRSGLEDKVIDKLTKDKVDFKYETLKLKYQRKVSTYTPDILLPNGLIVEVKGFFDSEDRSKHLLIKDQHPDIEIRFVFQKASTKIRKGSNTSYGDWCDKYGFIYAEGLIPKEWYGKRG
jgi:ATP-dependent protease ClpP protease subunit